VADRFSHFAGGTRYCIIAAGRRYLTTAETVANAVHVPCELMLDRQAGKVIAYCKVPVTVYYPFQRAFVLSMPERPPATYWQADAPAPFYPDADAVLN
jgi:hypothetical protein